MNKVVIIGCGNVGMASAYALLLQGSSINELVLIDIDKKKVEGEVLDLNHALSYFNRGMQVFAGDYSDCEDASIIVICAGKNQEKGETRTDLLHKNYAVFNSIISSINKTNFKGIYLIATNPVDTMTLVTQKLSGFPASRVIGSGTTLDTARLRYLISEKININTSNIHGYVIGEHGDSELIAWDNVTVGADSVMKLIDSETAKNIAEDVKQSAYKIIEKKGNTCYGIGACVLKIVNAILQNENSIMTVSSYDKQRDIYYSLPAIINRSGVRKVLPLTLSEKDEIKLKNSMDTLASIRDEIL